MTEIHLSAAILCAEEGCGWIHESRECPRCGSAQGVSLARAMAAPEDRRAGLKGEPRRLRAIAGGIGRARP